MKKETFKQREERQKDLKKFNRKFIRSQIECSAKVSELENKHFWELV